MKMTLEEILSSSPSILRRFVGNDFTMYIMNKKGSEIYQRSFDDVLRIRTESVSPDKIEVCSQVDSDYLFSFQDRVRS